jgi:hypothetical protein
MARSKTHASSLRSAPERQRHIRNSGAEGHGQRRSIPKPSGTGNVVFRCGTIGQRAEQHSLSYLEDFVAQLAGIPVIHELADPERLLPFRQSVFGGTITLYELPACPSISFNRFPFLSHDAYLWCSQQTFFLISCFTFYFISLLRFIHAADVQP